MAVRHSINFSTVASLPFVLNQESIISENNSNPVIFDWLAPQRSISAAGISAGPRCATNWHLSLNMNGSLHRIVIICNLFSRVIWQPMAMRVDELR